MAGRYTLLSTALAAELQTLLAARTDVTIERRLRPRRKRTEFAADQIYISVFAGASGWEHVQRDGATEQWEAVIAIQAAGPAPDPTAGGNAFGSVTSPAADPVAWGDSVFDLVETVKGYWRSNGSPLRDKELAGCTFLDLEHNPVYVPEHLEHLGILSVILALTYRVTDTDDE